MNKYKIEDVDLKNTSKGWTKNNAGNKFYRKDNWMIANYNHLGIDYWIIDESYGTGFYITRNKQKFLEEKHMLKVKKTPVWKALHGEYDE